MMLGTLSQTGGVLRTFHFREFDFDRLVAAKKGRRISVVLPARDEAATVAAAVQTQIEDGGWVDRALYRISNGTDKSVPALGDALAKLGRAVAARRKARDEQFAAMLAVWTSSGSEPGSLLTVESFARRVLEPLKKSQPGFLFLLVDALSAAAAADLGADLRRSGVWTEYDPLAGSAPFGRRRGMAAALPHVVAEDTLVMANAVAPTVGTIVSFAGGTGVIGQNQGFTIFGQVTDQDTNPVEGVTITLTKPDNMTATTTTDASWPMAIGANERTTSRRAPCWRPCETANSQPIAGLSPW